MKYINSYLSNCQVRIVCMFKTLKLRDKPNSFIHAILLDIVNMLQTTKKTVIESYNTVVVVDDDDVIRCYCSHCCCLLLMSAKLCSVTSVKSIAASEFSDSFDLKFPQVNQLLKEK